MRLKIFSLLFAFGVLAAQNVVAQTTTARATMALVPYLDADQSGTTTCGDIATVIVTLNSTVSGQDLREPSFVLPYPSAGTVIPGSVVVANPASPSLIETGDKPGDRELRVRWAEICNSASRCDSRGVSIAFQIRINNPNPATGIALQGTLSGANFSTVKTDWLATAAPMDAAVLSYDPCPPSDPSPAGGPFVRGFMIWSLATDIDHDGLADPGDTIRYTIDVRNDAPPGDQNAGGVIFASGVDSESTFLPGSVTTTRGSVAIGNGPTDSSVRVAVGTLPLGSFARITFNARLKAAIPASTRFLTCQGLVTGANFDDTPTDDPTTPAFQDPTFTPIDGDPDLSVTKGDGGVTAGPNSRITYTLTVSNLSNRAEATGVILRDELPPHLTPDSPNWSCINNLCSLALPPVLPGGSVTSTLVAVVAPTIPAGVFSLTDVATVADDGRQGPDPNLANNRATEATPVNPAAFRVDLAVTKTDNGLSVNPGETIVYEITAANLGNRGVSNARLVEAVPAGSQFEPLLSTPGWVCAGSSCSLTLPVLNPGPPTAVRFAVRAATTFPAGQTILINSVTLSDDGMNGPDADPSNNTASDTTPLNNVRPDVRITKIAPTGSFQPGDSIPWTLRVENQGNQTATNVVVQETFSYPVNVDPATLEIWSCDLQRQHCELTIPSLAPGASMTLGFTIVVVPFLEPGIDAVTNCAQVGEDQSCASVPLEANPDLEVTKLADVESISAGGKVVYTVIVRNLGKQQASGIVLTETIPPHTRLLPEGTDPAWRCSGAVCKADIDLRPFNSGVGLLFAIELDEELPEDLSILSNTAMVNDDGMNGPDPNPANNTATLLLPVTAATSFPPTTVAATMEDILTLDQGPEGASPGDEITYRVQIDNRGSRPARNLQFNVGVDPHTTLIAGSVTVDAGTVLVGNSPGDGVVVASLERLGFEEWTIQFKVRVASPLPANLENLSNQGQVTAANLEDVTPVLTDDPDFPGSVDPTLTPVAPPEPGGPDGPEPVDVPALDIGGLCLLVISLGFAAFRRLRPEAR